MGLELRLSAIEENQEIQAKLAVLEGKITRMNGAPNASILKRLTTIVF